MAESINEPAGLEEQLQIYAQELHGLYLAEKKEREQLAEEKLVLEYKLQELSALNSLFQKHLEQRRQVEEAYQHLVEQLKRLSSQPRGKDLLKQLEHIVAEAQTATGSLSIEKTP